MYNLGWAPWDLSCFEFKFDDTRLFSCYKNKIGPIEIFVCYILTLLRICTIKPSEGNKKIQLGQSYSYVMRKLWYHRIWIQNNLGFYGVRHNVHTSYTQSLTKAIIFELFYYINGYFRV